MTLLFAFLKRLPVIFKELKHGLNHRAVSETAERIIKLLQEGNSAQRVDVEVRTNKKQLTAAEEKQPRTVDGWMEVRLRDESPRRRCCSLVQ